MGQSSSSGTQGSNGSPWPPPKIDTVEQFIERFRDVFGSACLLPVQTEWLQTLTAKIGTPADNSAYWTQTDLANFLLASFPNALHEDIQTARPLIYQCLLHLGSFPYLNQPAPALTTDVMRVALAILLQRHRVAGRPVGISGKDIDSEEMQAHGMRSLLFQSMRTTQPAAKRADRERSKADEDYLVKAHSFVSEFNYRRHSRCATRVEWGPPIISVAELPSPASADYSGTVPGDELLSFVKLCSKLDPQHKVDGLQLTKLGAHGAEEFGWQDFGEAIGSMKYGDETYLLDGMALLFTPFVTPPTGISVDTIKAASNEEVLELLQRAGPPNTNAKY